MNKQDIKTKKVIKDIKEKNNQNNIKHYIKDKTIHDKTNTLKKEESEKKEINEGNYPVQKIEETQRTVAIESYSRTKRIIKEKNIQRKQTKLEEQQSTVNDKFSKIKSKNKLRITKTKTQSDIQKKSKVKFTSGNNNKTKNRFMITKKENHFNSIKETSNNYYKNRMKSHILKQHRLKLKNSPIDTQINHNTFSASKMIKKPFRILSKTFNSLSKLWSYGTGLILLLVIYLFIGVFGSLSNNNNINTENSPLSAEVLAYEGIITQYASHYGIEEYVPIIEAIMMQESGGKGNDPMQAAECEFNTKYPHVPNGIQDPVYSIEVGIQNFADCLATAKVLNINDNNNLYLALQGYNYGKAYITWASEIFGCYSKANAKIYSDNKKNELKVKVYGDPEYVEHVLRYYHFGSSNIVDIARNEIGNKGGEKYWRWYGFNQRVNWCAIFVSWCANESGIMNNTIPRFSLCIDGEKWYKEHSKWKNKSYIPQTGDIIFFDWNGDDHVQHVGIVEKVENDKVYTIEGNSNDEVRNKSYSLNNKSIYGYGSVN
ncbi:lysozyme family protein [Faecalibacillus faecis]|uniref:lysozyme family protein n=1 Tax=Faecalibacillus faecis TaxID=1982628 RepID=UPI0032C08F99